MKKCCALALGAAFLINGSIVAMDKKGDAAKGKEVFEQCSVCHYATTDQKKMGPSLKGLFKRPKLGNGLKPTDENVLNFISKGKGSMPAFASVLSAEEKDNLLAYLKTL
ncbi:MAG: c-type cytochrome [Bryobacteraceae bacterium]